MYALRVRLIGGRVSEMGSKAKSELFHPPYFKKTGKNVFAIGGPAIILVSVNVRIVVLPVEYGNGFVCLQVQYFQCGTVLDVSDVFPIRRILGLETGSLF